MLLVITLLLIKPLLIIMWLFTISAYITLIINLCTKEHTTFICFKKNNSLLNIIHNIFAFKYWLFFNQVYNLIFPYAKKNNFFTKLKQLCFITIICIFGIPLFYLRILAYLSNIITKNIYLYNKELKTNKSRIIIVFNIFIEINFTLNTYFETSNKLNEKKVIYRFLSKKNGLEIFTLQNMQKTLQIYPWKINQLPELKQHFYKIFNQSNFEEKTNANLSNSFEFENHKMVFAAIPAGIKKDWKIIHHALKFPEIQPLNPNEFNLVEFYTSKPVDPIFGNTETLIGSTFNSTAILATIPNSMIKTNHILSSKFITNNNLLTSTALNLFSQQRTNTIIHKLKNKNLLIKKITQQEETIEFFATQNIAHCNAIQAHIFNVYEETFLSIREACGKEQFDNAEFNVKKALISTVIENLKKEETTKIIKEMFSTQELETCFEYIKQPLLPIFDIENKNSFLDN